MKRGVGGEFSNQQEPRSVLIVTRCRAPP